MGALWGIACEQSLGLSQLTLWDSSQGRNNHEKDNGKDTFVCWISHAACGRMFTSRGTNGYASTD
jgi:hypothetical protein